MLSTLCCTLALSLVGMTSEVKEEQKAARAFERNMVADEADAARAQKDYDRAQGEINHEASERALQEKSSATKYALARKLVPSPRWGIELRFGPYRPQVSTNKEVGDLYNLVFNTSSNSWFKGKPMQMGLEVDAYPFREFGLLGFFGRVAYWRTSGPTRLCLDGNQNPVQCTGTTVFESVQGNDQAQLSAVPVSLGVVWRVDALRRLTPVPVQLNVKAALDYHFWWANSGDKASTYQGHRARGGTLGYNISIGASFGLEIFSQATLANRSSGIKSAIFAEYQVMRGSALVGKDRAHRLDFTDNTLVIVGLACDFL